MAYYVNIINKSNRSDVEITHVWLELDPPIHDFMNPGRPLPVRLRPSEPWSTWILGARVPVSALQVEWSARCRLAHNGKVVKSRPAKNMPPFGAVPGARAEAG
jgi:hypothetical protein